MGTGDDILITLELIVIAPNGVACSCSLVGIACNKVEIALD